MITNVLAFALGILAAVVAAWIYHVLSVRRADRESRRNDISFWREWADDFANLFSKKTDLQSLVVATKLPDDPMQIIGEVIADLDRLKLGLTSLDSRIRRAPEPLTTHVRLFIHRMERAGQLSHFDWEIGKPAIRDFRSALDYYVRTGRSMKLPLAPDDSLVV